MRQRRVTTETAPKGQSKRSKVDRNGSSSYPRRDTGEGASTPARTPRTARCVSVLGLVGVVALAVSAQGCLPEFDTSRVTPVRGTVGEEMYGVLCDRVGAQALREDLTGASFQAVCHKDAAGAYADQVDQTKLPTLSASAKNEKGGIVPLEEQQASRDKAIGRVEAMARRRADLVRALDATFPEGVKVAIKDLDNGDETKSCDAPAKSGEGLLTQQIADMLGRMGDLYNDGTLPQSTESLARVVDAFNSSDEAQGAWARLSARQGYRPIDTALGVARPVIAYPHLRDLSNASLRLLSADSTPYEIDPKHDDRGQRVPVPGPGNAALDKMLEAGHEEMLAVKADPKLAPLALAKDLSGRTVLSRPRDNVEMLEQMLFASDPSFGNAAAKPTYIVKRDARGYAAIAGGAVPAPFIDADGDGLPDVDASGRFLTTNNSLAPSPFPFSGGPGEKGVQRDAQGRALAGSQLLYDYLDTSHTFAAQMMADMKPLVNPDVTQNHETLMDTLGGIQVAVGPRVDRTKAYGTGKTVAYKGISPDSPLLDLVYATGAILGDRNADQTLALVSQLFQQKPKEMARVTGALSKAFDVAQKHGEAKIPRTSTYWDETLEATSAIAHEPGLLEDLLKALAAPESAQLGTIFSSYAKYRDDIGYDPSDINGAPYNYTTKSQGEMSTPVDRTKPETGKNRSGLYRFLGLISDTTGVTACNKNDAVVHAELGGINIPSFGLKWKECEVFKIENLAAFYLDSMANAQQYDTGTVKRGTIYMRPGVLRAASGPGLIENSSGIQGMWPDTGSTIAPTPKFLNRLVFFDVNGDTQNAKTKLFVKDLQGEFMGTSVCPERIIDDPSPGAADARSDGKIRGLRSCADGQWLQQRGPYTLFTWENFGFYDAMRPLLGAFVKHGREDLFLQISNATYKHWPGAEATTDECRLPGNVQCPRSGMNSYSALIAEAFAGDALPAIVELAKALENLPIQRCDATDAKGNCTKVTNVTGIDVAAAATRAMTDADYAKTTLQLEDRKGNVTAKRNDGTTTPQVTPMLLLTNALGGIDLAFDTYEAQNPGDTARRANWRRARSQLVDQFMAVSGAKATSQFANPTMPKMAPVIVELLRSQLLAHCPQSFTPPYAKCAWATTELTQKATDTLTGPLAGAGLDVMEAIRADQDGRVQMEKLLQYLLDAASQNDALASVLASSNDVVQMLRDEENLVPLFHVLASTMDRSKVDDKGRVTEKSLVDAQMALLARLSGKYFDKEGLEICKREIDPNQVLTAALANLVTPIKDGDFNGQSPLEVIIDVIADVNRVDPTQKYEGTLARSDYGSVGENVVDFLTNKQRGLEQFYEVIRTGTR
ncbi:MAG: hypothetical protein JWP97_6154 [Labilithrix sp.]|nr:hypothetical protein [Labilithrix sp.]